MGMREGERSNDLSAASVVQPRPTKKKRKKKRRPLLSRSSKKRAANKKQIGDLDHKKLLAGLCFDDKAAADIIR